MRTEIELLYQGKVKSELFGARGCSGGCQCDPCDCDPCTCGSDDEFRRINPARWRVCGRAIFQGELQGIDVAGLVLCSLSLPIGEGWREVILVDSRASDDQVASLLTEYEAELASMPSEHRTPERPSPTVFRVPMTYRKGGMAMLDVTCSPETLELVRTGAVSNEPFTWSYCGPMVPQRSL
jgi:hypothetical protein